MTTTLTKLPTVTEINKTVMKELANKEIMLSLIDTTFKGLGEIQVKKAITEGIMRGFEFKDFLEKNVYAIPFAGGYSLITSIDYARKIGSRSGVVGKSAPSYEMVEGSAQNNERVLSCTVTIKKKDKDGYVGEFTETVYFNEYTTGKNQWATKPRTMIAKVAEMHALRMACPEELSKAYAEEELQKEAEIPEISEEDLILYTEKLESVKTLEELKVVWAELPLEVKQKLEARKDQIKAKLSPKK